MKKLVIVGGGFAGAYIAKKLERKFETTLIDTKDYFEFTPSVLKVIVNPDLMKGMQVLHKKYLKNSKIVLGEVKDVGNKSVLVNNQRIPFDYLVIAAGSGYESPIKQENVVIDFRAKNLLSYHRNLEKAKSVLVVGGGLVGVELVSEIVYAYPEKKIILVTGSEKLIPRNTPHSSEIVEEHFKEKKIEVRLNENIDLRNGIAFSKNKGMIKADLTFICTGIKPNSEFMKRSFSSKISEGFVNVNKFLQMEGVNNIFVAGDIAYVKEEKTAQNAEKQAKKIVKNLINLEKKKPLKEYVSKKRPFVISLGDKGIFEYNDSSWYGWLPAVMKRVIQWKTMWRYR